MQLLSHALKQLVIFAERGAHLDLGSKPRPIGILTPEKSHYFIYAKSSAHQLKTIMNEAFGKVWMHASSAVKASLYVMMHAPVHN